LHPSGSRPSTSCPRPTSTCWLRSAFAASTQDGRALGVHLLGHPLARRAGRV